ALAVPLVLDPLEREEIAATTDGKHMKTRGLCCGDGRLRPGIVSKYDCRSTLGKQRFKQPQLGAMILFHRGMVVHMVAAKIGEGAGIEADAVQPPLVETMAGCLHRSMGYAGLRQLRQQLVQGDLVRRCKGAIFVA